ncbi:MULTISPECIES: hypothetical protein [Providencia]|uniref:Uncharacterized protein n=1 Tax=Providencia huashanensis TaxID=3037798 RepID=A0AA42K2J5_9GAMM|nr:MULTISPECIES: hypothetical protein [Providencia]MBC8653762.1 hypothetical protein [Providencia vermicola]APC11668.1 hypothetical protein RB151_019950 [Providencia rettgeri]EIL1985247.1 hypothetical protein [Providencia rettgeri]EIL1985387.1 hypothetical protein [Providencia rettgeri]EIU7555256.1 hypothetical protein [Providencia rettgeri]
MPTINPMELISYTIANTIKMVVTPVEYIVQSGAIGDVVFISWLFIG